MTQPQLEGLTGLIYTRKSALSDGRSTADQDEHCRSWSEGAGISIAEVICDEGKGATRYSTKTRDGWTELKERLRTRRYQILVVWEASRAYRDLKEFAAFRDLCTEHKVLLAYSGRVFDFSNSYDRLTGGMDALWAEHEGEQIRERFMRGKEGAMRRGTPQAALGWGWRPVPKQLGEKRTQWEIDPDEAPRIREAIRRKIDGETLLSIHRWLQTTGTCKAPKRHSALRRSLLRPSLAGFRTHNGKIIETEREDGMATWEPIITVEDHEKLKASFKWDHPNPGPEPRHLLSGIAICDECGETMRYHHSKKKWHIYRCPTGCVSRGKEMLERGVEKAILRRLRNINPADYSSDNPEVVAAEERIAELEAELAEWEEKALNEEVSPSFFAKIQKDRLGKIADLRPRTEPVADRLLTYATWHDGSLHEQRETIRRLISIRVPKVFKTERRRATEDDVIIRPIKW